ncbi:MAG: glycosyltransferase family 4 protein, partial [Anaerolineae bacterium]|nr:glycosyltransferase family 4 protein [Anaerolineae bacterium]
LFGRKIDTVMRKAVLVVAGNEYLASRARQAGAKEVATLPSVVDASRYEVIEAQGKQRLTIGWIGSPTTALFLHACRKALGHAVTHYDARLVLIGSGSIQVGKLPLEIQPWSEDTETTAIKAFDIGIMPMPDNPWTRGKCGYKLIQYMASGIPVIASPVGVNSDIVEHGHNGFLATEPEEWIEALSRLISDADLRARMGAAGRAKVDTEYSLQIMAPKLLAILEQAVRH